MHCRLTCVRRCRVWSVTFMLLFASLLPISAAATAACEEGILPGGALYRICIPAIWNQQLVLYAHGYVAPNQPLRLPDDDLALNGGQSVSDLLTDLGYAFATTSYRTNGLVVPLALQDLLELSARFETTVSSPARQLLVGASDGGLIAVLAAERYPNTFDSALALCGPYGGFDAQINYFGDFRVLFDYFFPGLMPATAVDIPPSLLQTWETTTYSDTVRPEVIDPANASALDQLLAVAGVAYDPKDPPASHDTVKQLLWYNVYATNDARSRLGGQPYDNQMRHYRGSTDDDQLNREVVRFAAEPAALASIAASYQPSGDLRVPVVTVHTAEDPIVPVWHSDRYQNLVAAAGASAWHEAYVLDRYGHCTFTALELFTFFNRTVELAATRRHIVYVPHLAAMD